MVGVCGCGVWGGKEAGEAKQVKEEREDGGASTTTTPNPPPPPTTPSLSPPLKKGKGGRAEEAVGVGLGRRVRQPHLFRFVIFWRGHGQCLGLGAVSPMLRTSVTAPGMSITVRYKWVFSLHNMKKLAVPGRLRVSLTIFALNPKWPPSFVRHAPHMYQLGSSSGTPVLLDTTGNGNFWWHFASCCILCMVRLDQDCQAEGPWCNQGAAKRDTQHGGSHDVSQSP